MLSEMTLQLSDWSLFDTWIVVTAALAAMACAIPGCFLLLRKQSMMGDALSHTALLGIVLAFLFAQGLKASGWISTETYVATRHLAMFLGAMIIGIVAALLTEWIQKIGRVEASAALGVVFTTLFAAGLLLLRLFADHVDIDPDCVLYGTIETVVLDTFGTSGVPRAAVVNGGMLLLNVILVLIFFKELRISAFDPALATALGINARLMHYGLMAVTAATLVAAFESVGSILVIGMLIVPAAAAHLLTDRLSVMIGLSLVIASASALLGHASAITLPSIIFGRIGFPTVIDASTAGMMAASSGFLFLLAMMFAPRYGLISKAFAQTNLRLKVLSEDMLGLLYRLEEVEATEALKTASKLMSKALGIGPLATRFALLRLKWNGSVESGSFGYQLTPAGRSAASRLVRSHRLWESYMARHFAVPDDHLHETAARVEHYINPELLEQLASELDQPVADPHGRAIPGEGKLTR